MTDVIWGAVISGSVALVLWFLQWRVSKRSINDAWQAQAEALRNELKDAHAEQLASRDATIIFLQGQLQAIYGTKPPIEPPPILPGGQHGP